MPDFYNISKRFEQSEARTENIRSPTKDNSPLQKIIRQSRQRPNGVGDSKDTQLLHSKSPISTPMLLKSQNPFENQLKEESRNTSLIMTSPQGKLRRQGLEHDHLEVPSQSNQQLLHSPFITTQAEEVELEYSQASTFVKTTSPDGKFQRLLKGNLQLSQSSTNVE